VETIVYVPRVHYRGGYRARVTGATVTSKAGTRYLALRRHRRARIVTLELGTRG